MSFNVLLGLVCTGIFALVLLLINIDVIEAKNKALVNIALIVCLLVSAAVTYVYKYE